MISGIDIHISPKYSRRYYLKFGLNLDSSEEVWKEAVDIFSDRIKGRYLESISKLIEDNKENDFAAMSLICLLIDTFMQFRLGIPQSETRASGDNYIRFMSKYFNLNYWEANRFYVDIRCGLLHSAETKNGSFLDPVHYENARAIKSFRIGENNNIKTILIVNVPSLYNKLINYFNEYCEELMDCNNTECRENFIRKMDNIAMKFDMLNGDYDLWAAICKNSKTPFVDNAGNRFSYHIVEREQVLVVASNLDKGKIRIPFADIKDFLYTHKSNGYCIKNYWLIEIILNACRDKVEEYTRISA